MEGEVYELVDARLAPPVEAAYQFTELPLVGVADKVTDPFPQRDPGVVDDKLGLVTVMVAGLLVIQTLPDPSLMIAR